MNFRVFAFAFFLIVTAASLCYYRIHTLDAELLPESGFSVWEIEARLVVPNPPKRLRVSLDIPTSLVGARIIEESFRSDGLAAGLVERNATKSVYWTGRPNSSELVRLAYIALMERGTEGVTPPSKLSPIDTLENFFTEKEQFSARSLVWRAQQDTDSTQEEVDYLLRCVKRAKCPGADFLGRFRVSERKIHRALAVLLNMAGHRSFVAQGFEADQPTNNARFRYWLRTKYDDQWRDISALNKTLDSNQLLFWSFFSNKSIDAESNDKAKIEFSLVPIEDFSASTSIGESEYQSLAWRMLSLRNLPISVQASYRIMLLIPIGALIIALYRCILGLPTFGTFLPVLVALAFRDTGLVWGLALLTLIVSLGLLVRSLLTNLRLLLVPRLAASLSIVILLILLISRLSYDFRFSQGLTVTLFPIVIVTMLIERMSISWEETGARKTITLFASSMLCSVLCYCAMMPQLVQYWVFTFPEITLVVLAGTLLCGRYTGYRLTELYRFRSFSQEAI